MGIWKSGILRLLPWALAASCAGPAAAGAAHEHGVARLDIGVETDRISLQLATPLDNLLGFERAPRSAAERSAAAAAVARLRDAATLFRIDGKAGCTPTAVELQSEALGLGPANTGGPAGTPHAASGSAHADLDAQYEFRCAGGGQAGFVDVALFEAFARLQRVELQIVTPRGQFKATLTRPQARVSLAR